ncbi:MAG: glycosyltransferase [Candidatus Eisenbacteria bacterium]|nr:glycosyltransferase [Candidatus Eisenbacteria bacterium]
MKPVRTLFVATTLAVGGAERILQHLALGLDRRRFDVSVATLREPGAIGEEIAAAGVPVRSALTGRGKLDPLLIPRLQRWIASERFRILYMLDHPHAIFHSALASLGTSVRVRVMPVHTTGRWGGLPSVPRSIRFFMPLLDRVIAIAEAQRGYLIRAEGIPPGKICVIRNAIPAEGAEAAVLEGRRRALREEFGVPAGARVVAILAVLRPEKNHELLLRAAARVRRDIPDLVVLVIGDGPRRRSLEDEAARLDLGGTVRFLGGQPNGRRLWPIADLAVLCSHPRVETLPLSLMEAMDAALPVVATDVGALSEIVESGKNGELVPAGDEEGLARAIGRILGDPARRLVYGRESQRLIQEQFRLERMLQETEDLLLRLMGG